MRKNATNNSSVGFTTPTCPRRMAFPRRKSLRRIAPGERRTRARSYVVCRTDDSHGRVDSHGNTSPSGPKSRFLYVYAGRDTPLWRAIADFTTPFTKLLFIELNDGLSFTRARRARARARSFVRQFQEPLARVSLILLLDVCRRGRERIEENYYRTLPGRA